MIRINRYFVVSLLCGCALFTATLGQKSKIVEGGIIDGVPYASTDFENINLTNGNLNLTFPLPTLRGRGEASFGYALHYNSKLWQTTLNPVHGQNGEITYQDFLQGTIEGGWTDRDSYQLVLWNRNSGMDAPSGNFCTGSTPWRSAYRWKLELNAPGGQKIEFRPTGYSDMGPGFTEADGGYFNIQPNGIVSTIGWSGGNCYPVESAPTYAPITYYSSDGSGLRLTVQASPTGPMTWELSMPDGKRVQQLTDRQRIIDRNGNFVETATITLPDGTQAGGWVDQFGRYIARKKNLATREDTYYQLGFDGALLTWKVKWKTVYVRRNYTTTCTSCGRQRGPVIDSTAKLMDSVVERIELPAQLGGLVYTFDYYAKNVDDENPSEGWGEVKSVTMPTGATVTYGYGMSHFDPAQSNLQEPGEIYPRTDWVLERAGAIVTKRLSYLEQYDGSTTPREDFWQYIIDRTGSSVIAPDGAVSSLFYWDIVNDQLKGGQVYKEIKPDGTVVEKKWVNNYPVGFTYGSGAHMNPLVKFEVTTIPNAVGSPALSTIKDYNYDRNGNLLEVAEYDWMPASTSAIQRSNGVLSGFSGLTPRRRSITTYLNPTPQTSSTATSANAYYLSSAPLLRGLPSSIEVLDGAGVPASRTEMSYDFANYDAGNTKAGNLVETKVWDSFKGGQYRAYSNPLTTANSIATSATYNQYGMPLTTTDANGAVTQITYGAVQGPNGAVFDLYPTQTVQAAGTSVARTSTAAYDFHTGLVTAATDADNNVSTVTEYDALGRPTKVRSAAGTPLESWVRTEYSEAERRVIVRSDLETLGDGRKVAIQHYDQLGRVRLSRTLENAATENPYDETHGIKVETRYRAAGPCTFDAGRTCGFRIASNPFRAAAAAQATNEPTMGWTMSQSRSDGRYSETQTFSGSALPSPFGGGNTNSTGIVKTSIDANATTVEDQAGKLRRSVADAIGQLVRVDEPNGSNQLGSVAAPNQPTYYYYNALGKMVRVQQGGQNRYFMYDSLSRMIRVRQPEQTVNANLATTGNPDNNSWTAGFAYDNNGNVVAATDAKNVTTASTYDAHNRALSRSFSDGITPAVTFTYDEPAVPFSKGKLTKVSSSVSESRYTQFDLLGRLKQFQQHMDGQTYTSRYEYNLSGALVKETYPSGREVRNEFDPSGDISRIFGKVSTSAPEKTYANAFSYFADGRIEKLRLGNGLWESAKVNSRLQVTEFNLGRGAASGNLWKNSYEYGELQAGGTVDATRNSGNIARQTVTFDGLAQPFVQTYQYDPLYRLTEAKETAGGVQTWRQTFGYDRYGNRIAHDKWIGATQQSLTAAEHPSIDPATNRISSPGFVFDANGNLIVDADGRQFAFNGDNKQTEVKDAQNNVIGRYRYDGEGKRIKKETASETTVFVYSGSKLIAEYSTAAPPANPTTSWTVTDQLGSPRVIVNAMGEVVSRRDFQPFGEELQTDGTHRTAARKYGQADSVRQKFTGYQKDEETGLDFAEARYYYNNHGRFTAVDPMLASGKSVDPQTFNRYVYVLNNPLSLTDPNGLQAGRQDYGSNQPKPTKVTDIFITISVKERKDNGAERDWYALAKSAPGYQKVNVYTVDDGTATVGQFKSSLESEGRTIVVYGHSVVDPDSNKRSAATGSRVEGIGLQFSDGTFQGNNAVREGQLDQPVDKVKANNVLLFTCDSGSVPTEIFSRMGAGGEVIQNGGGPNGASSVKYQEEAAYAATSKLLNGGTMKEAQTAAQNAINKSTIATQDKGDVILRLARRAQ